MMSIIAIVEFLLVKLLPSLFPLYLSPLIQSVGLLVVFFIDGIIIGVLFTSIIMTLLYYPFLLFAYSVIVEQNIEILPSIDLFTLSLTYFISAFIVTFIGWFIRRNMSDFWIEQLYLFGYKVNLKLILIGLLLSSVLYFVFRNIPLLIGGIIDVIGISLFGDYYDLPLVLLSWFSLPYSFTPKGNFSMQGICVGKLLGVLSKSSFIDSSAIKVNTARRYKWINVKADYCIDFSRTKNYNIVIIGTSGSGKSSFAKLLASRLNVKVLVFDVHGEYYLNNIKRIDVSQVSLNPLSLFNRNPRERALEVSYMIKSLFNLGNIQTIELTNLLIEAYMEKGIDPDDPSTWLNPPPTFRDVLLLIERHKKTALTTEEINRYQSLVPYLQYLSSTIFSSNSLDLSMLINESLILDFSRIPTNEVKYVIMETILKSIQSYMYLRKSPKLENLVIIDEAPFILSKDSGKQLVERLLAEGRKFGFGFLLISQNVEYLKEFIANAGLFFAFNIVEPGDIDYVSKFFGGSDLEMYYTLYETLPKLPRGVSVTRDLLGRFIYLVQFYEEG